MATVQVYFTSEFKRNIRRLAKKYRHVRQDIEPLIAQLLDGQTPGEQVPRVQYTVFKVRIQNSDIDKGKRSGYRLIYYVKTPEAIVLITIYVKAEQGDIEPEQLRRIINDFNVSEN